MRPAPVATVSWRDGVHLTGTPIWCDARRRRDVCFVSSADRVGRAGHGQLIATPLTLALIGAEGGGHLGVPVRRPFTLGTLRLELIPSGRGLGAAALHVDGAARTVLYAGPIRTADSGEPAELRTCEAVVVAAPFGEPHHKFGKLETIAGRLVAWLEKQRAAGKPAILTVDTIADGLEVASRLTSGRIAVAGSRSLREAADRIAELASPVTIAAPGRGTKVIVRIEGDRLKDIPKAVTALVSGRALDGHDGWDAGFAWPFVAGREQVLAWIEQTKAREVFVTGACAEAIAGAVGARARVLGPPRQMALFPREAMP